MNGFVLTVITFFAVKLAVIYIVCNENCYSDTTEVTVQNDSSLSKYKQVAERTIR